MKTTRLIAPVALVLALWSSAHAQQNAPAPAPPPSAAPKYSASDLEKLAAPIAMHPDPLIAILLPASVYPLEIVQAARFVQDTNNIPKVDEQSWDENVKALAKFPELIQKMNDDLTWTMDLGQAFLDQQTELMDTIQSLRGKAQTLGTLKTTPQQIVVVTNTVIERTVEQQVVFVTNTVVQIQPSNPQVIYVPTYPPSMYYYYPPPVYVGPPPAVTFAVGVTVGLIIANNCDWHHGGIYVGHHGVAVWGGGYHGGGYHGDVDIDINRNVNINNINVDKNIVSNGCMSSLAPRQTKRLGPLATDMNPASDEKRAGAIWGTFIGDALAMPVHWYYDRAALRRDYGIVRDYVVPRNPHPDNPVLVTCYAVMTLEMLEWRMP